MRRIRRPSPAARATRSGAAGGPAAAQPAPDSPRLSPLAWAVAACLALRVLASFVPGNLAWGLDALRFWPVAAAVALVALGTTGFVPAISRPLGAALAWAGERWTRAGVAADLALSTAIALALFCLRDPVQFVGDFHLRVGSLATNLPPARMFPQAFPLDLFVNVTLARALCATGLSPVTAMQAVGAAVALVFAFAAIAFARSCGARGAALPAAVALLLGGGWLVHMAGYGKFGPLLVGVTVAAVGIERMARRGDGAWWLAAGTALCVLSHRAGYLVLPAALFTFVLAWRAAATGRERTALLAPAALLTVVAAFMLARAWTLALQVDVSAHVAPVGAAASPGAWLLRVTDAVNALFLLAPLWPVGMIALAAPPAHGAADRARFSRAPVAWLALAAQAVFLFAVRAGQGDARDWDVFTMPALVISLVGVHALVRAAGRGFASGALTGAVTGALAAAIAFWGVNLSEAMQLRLVEARLHGRPAWTDAQRAEAFDYLGTRSLREQRYDDAARQLADAIACAPNPRFYHERSLALLGGRRLAEAAADAETVARLAPLKADPWWVLARVAALRGDTARARACVDSARVRGSTTPAAGL